MKFAGDRVAVGVQGSPPTRGAWIEIPISPTTTDRRTVAPHTGGVD